MTDPANDTSERASVIRPARPVWLGRRRYGPVHTLQERLQEARHLGTVIDTVLLLEHEPVATLGRRADPEHLLSGPDGLRSRGLDVFETGRGGDATFHGPGQLVVYPIVDLKPDRCDVRRYVRDLGRAMIDLLAVLGLEAAMLDGELLGVWLDRASPTSWKSQDEARDLAKIGAIGVRLSRWISMHGFALNGSTDLGLFTSAVVPCGLVGRGVTSIEELLGQSPPVDELARGVLGPLGSALGLEFAPLLDLSHLSDDAVLAALVPPSSTSESDPT